MKKNKWLFALLVGATVFTAACADDAGKGKNKGNDPVVEPEPAVQYLLQSQSTPCSLALETNQAGQIVVSLSSLTEGASQMGAVAGSLVTATTESNLFTLQDSADKTVTVTTGIDGSASIRVQAGVSEGTGSISITADPNLDMMPGYNRITCTVSVKEPAAPIIEPTKKDIHYHAKMTYSGDKTLSVAEALVFEGKSCSELVRAEMKPEDVLAISSEYTNTQVLVGKTVEQVDFPFTFSESEKVNYAVVGRAAVGSDYVAVGCVDGMNQDNTTVTVPLVYIGGEDPIVDPPGPVDPPYVAPELDYTGSFSLTSQFDALSLLPTAPKPANGSVLFKDMLLGDWIKFALNFLSNPEKAVPALLTEQLIPLLTSAEWFINIVKMIPGMENLANLIAENPGMVSSLLETFGVNKMVEDLLSQVTGQLSWWKTATGAVTIVNNLATNFTLYGDFTNVTEKTDDYKPGVEDFHHNYGSLLYNNGSFPECKIGKAFSKDVDGNVICQISISSLDKSSSVTGDFTATFSDVEKGVGTVDIPEHPLKLAYGKLIYAALVQVLPQFVPGMPKNTDTLGKIVAFFMGELLININNKGLEPETEEYTKYYIGDPDIKGCKAVGQFIFNKLDQTDNGFANMVKPFAQPTMVQSLCDMGVNALDKLIDDQLNKLSVSSDAVTFSSEGCNVHYATDDHDSPTRIMYFGTDEHTWGSKVTAKDLCDWSLKIKTNSTDSEGNEKTKINVIEGKFWAVGSLD